MTVYYLTEDTMRTFVTLTLSFVAVWSAPTMMLVFSGVSKGTGSLLVPVTALML